MIELIFAIVIMGIVMMSAPMLIQTSSNSSFVALQQESIAAVASQMGMILTSEWDESDTNTTIGEPVLRTGSAAYNPCNSTQVHPIGVTSSSGRYCRGLDNTFGYVATAPNALGTDPGDIFYDDVDDYDNTNSHVLVYDNETIQTSSGDYIDQNITLNSQVIYSKNDNFTGTAPTLTFSNPFQATTTALSTNIKLITVTLNSANIANELKQKSIRLSAFVCNIGAPNPKPVSNESSL
jgi:type II secretory pathway pseudopilin PulG